MTPPSRGTSSPGWTRTPSRARATVLGQKLLQLLAARRSRRLPGHARSSTSRSSTPTTAARSTSPTRRRRLARARRRRVASRPRRREAARHLARAEAAPRAPRVVHGGGRGLPARGLPRARTRLPSAAATPAACTSSLSPPGWRPACHGRGAGAPTRLAVPEGRWRDVLTGGRWSHPTITGCHAGRPARRDCRSLCLSDDT